MLTGGGSELFQYRLLG